MLSLTCMCLADYVFPRRSDVPHFQGGTSASWDPRGSRPRSAHDVATSWHRVATSWHFGSYCETESPLRGTSACRALPETHLCSRRTQQGAVSKHPSLFFVGFTSLLRDVLWRRKQTWLCGRRNASPLAWILVMKKSYPCE